MRTVKLSLLLGVILLALEVTASFAQSFTVLHAFSTNADGQFPNGGVVLSGGTLFGATYQGDNGSGYDSGVVYSVSTNGSNFTLLHSFSGPDGQNPSTLPVVSGGMIYGTASQGGPNLDGVLYSMSTNGSNFTVLHAFDDGPGGKNPQGALLLAGGTLFGTTSYNTSNGYGAVYSISTNGSNFTVLHGFSNLLNGGDPVSGQLALSGSTLYGVTLSGGTNNVQLTNGYGILYALGTNGANFNILHEFRQAEGIPSPGNLVISGNTLYGCTQSGGSNGFGSIFAVGTDGSNYRQLHAFAGSDGSTPGCTLLLSSNTLFGTTEAGGSGGSGTVFSINTDGSGYQVLYNFSATTNNVAGTNADGMEPVGSLILSGRYLFGVGYAGGPNKVGTIFQLDPPPSQPAHPAFFAGENALGSDWYYLQFPDGTLFGYYNYDSFPYLYHMDLGFEYFFDANDGHGSAYFYDFKSGHFWYTNPALFPYIYDFSLSAWVYYFKDSTKPDHYQTSPRWFVNLSTGKYITM